MKPADQRWNDMAMFGVVVIAGAVKVGGHDAAIINAMAFPILTIITFAQLDAGNLGNGIGLIGRFQRTGQ